VENAVRYCFVEGAFIPIRREIKLERFAFDAKSIRNIIDIDSGKIRLPRDWANRSEIVRFKVNLVIAARGIRKSLKPRLRRGGWKFRFTSSKEREAGRLFLGIRELTRHPDSVQLASARSIVVLN